MTQNAWQSNCRELAAWALERLAIKQDRHGQYSADGRAKWSSTPVTKDRLAAHFAGADTIGLGATSLDDQCIWVAWDLDNHVSDVATSVNQKYAIVLRDRLFAMGFRAIIIEDSDGKGGIHVWLLFSSPISAAIVHHFAKSIASGFAEHGLKKIECFPKNSTVQHTDAKCGHYLRIPGKHHKRDHWSRFYASGDWLSQADSVQLLLSQTGDDPALISVIEFERRQESTLPPHILFGDDRDIFVDALHAIPNSDLHYDDWLKIGMALHACDPRLLEEFQRWSSTSQKHNPQTTTAKWNSFNSNGMVQPGTLIYLAKAQGWTDPRKQRKSVVRSYDWTDLNDIGNAADFAASNVDELRYCVAWEKWLNWDGTRWKIDDEGRPLKLATEMVVRMFSDVMETKQAQQLKHVCDSAKIARLKAMIELAGPNLPIRVEELDQDVWILNCKNGIIDLRTGKLLPHDRNKGITTLCPTAFDISAESPVWNQFLQDVFADDDLIQFVQRLFGCFLTGDVSEQKLAIFYGTGANGKSTLLNAFMDTIGPDYTMQCMPDFLMEKKRESHPTEKASLFGKRFVSCVETEASRKLAESTVKMLTGGEKIMARRMREDFWEFDPTHKLVLCTNHRPIIAGTDHGIWRRLLLVPFLQRFDGDRQDKQLPEKLRAERAGILAWAVRGCLEWQRIGLNPPVSVTGATEDYRSSEDIFGRFMADCCVVSKNTTVKFSDLYARFEQWAHDGGEYRPSTRAVGVWLDDNGFEKYASNGRWYRGLMLRSTSAAENVFTERTE